MQAKFRDTAVISVFGFCSFTKGTLECVQFKRDSFLSLPIFSKAFRSTVYNSEKEPTTVVYSKLSLTFGGACIKLSSKIEVWRIMRIEKIKYRYWCD